MKKVVFLLLVASFVSCARSTVRFKGSGEIEFQYQGVSAPRIDSND